MNVFLSSSVLCLFFDTFYLVFVFFNFSNVLSVYLNPRVYLFVLVFVVEMLFRLAVFSRNLLRGDAHSSVALNRHVQDRQHLPTHLRVTLGICLLTWSLGLERCFLRKVRKLAFWVTAEWLLKSFAARVVVVFSYY